MTDTGPASRTQSEAPSEKDEIDILMREYLALRAEILEFVRYYRAHARYAGVFLGVVVALVSFAAKSDGGLALAHSRLFVFAIGIGITTAVTYFAFDALEAQYAMFAVGSRAATLEDEINNRAGKRLLIWESILSDRYWWMPKHNEQYWWQWESPLQGVKYPSKFLVLYMLLFLLLALFVVPTYSAYAFWFNPRYTAHVWATPLLTSINFVYSIISFVLIVRVAPSVLWRMKAPARMLARETLKDARITFAQRRC
jgi:hypothetical protein